MTTYANSNFQWDESRTWEVEDGLYRWVGKKARQVPAYRASNGVLASQLTTVRSEAENWANALNKGHRPIACKLDVK